jgi:hypothetical protein
MNSGVWKCRPNNEAKSGCNIFDQPGIAELFDKYEVHENFNSFDIKAVTYKVKVQLSLCLTKHHAMKTYWEWRYSSTHS